jgi:hypothetical protein
MKKSDIRLLLFIVILLIIVDIYLMFVFSFNIMKYVGQGKQILVRNKVIIGIAFIIFIYVEITFHELGHYLYGKYKKFVFYSFTIFPFSIKKKKNNIRVELTYEFLNQGSCSMLPRKVEDIYTYLPIYNLCGPISDFILVLIGVLYFLYLIKSTQTMTIEIMLICIFVLVNQLTFVLNLMPMDYGGYSSDGTKLLYFIRNSDSDQQEIQNFYISSQLIIGVRPKNIRFIKHYKDKIYGSQNRNLLLDIYMYYYFFDSGDECNTLEQINMLEKTKEDYYSIMGESVKYEIFYACCVLKNNFEKAENLYSNISDSINNTYKITSCRIKMAYELYVKNDIEKALEIGEKGLISKDEYPIEGMAVFEYEQIKKMMNELSSEDRRAKK